MVLRYIDGQMKSLSRALCRYQKRCLTMVTGVVNILLSSMSTGRREEGATVSKRVFNTPNASGESRCIWEAQQTMFTNDKKGFHQTISKHTGFKSRDNICVHQNVLSHCINISDVMKQSTFA